jgi:hypothetical protein
MGNIIAELLQGPPLRERSCCMCPSPAVIGAESRAGKLVPLCLACFEEGRRLRSPETRAAALVSADLERRAKSIRRVCEKAGLDPAWIRSFFEGRK